jgi:hypothetical protein
MNMVIVVVLILLGLFIVSVLIKADKGDANLLLTNDFFGEISTELVVVLTAEKKENGLQFKNPSEFTVTKQLLSSDLKTGLALDVQRGKLWLVSTENNILNQHILSFSDLISISLVEDNVVTEQTNRTQQLVGVAAGGLLLGGVGAIIGGLSASKSIEEKVNGLKLIFIINDYHTPNFVINLTNDAVAKGTATYLSQKKIADEWLATLSVAIHRQGEICN